MGLEGSLDETVEDRKHDVADCQTGYSDAFPENTEMLEQREVNPELLQAHLGINKEKAVKRQRI